MAVAAGSMPRSGEGNRPAARALDFRHSGDELGHPMATRRDQPPLPEVVVLINPFRVPADEREHFLANCVATMERLERQDGFLGGGLHELLQPVGPTPSTSSTSVTGQAPIPSAQVSARLTPPASSATRWRG